MAITFDKMMGVVCQRFGVAIAAKLDGHYCLCKDTTNQCVLRNDDRYNPMPEYTCNKCGCNFRTYNSQDDDGAPLCMNCRYIRMWDNPTPSDPEF